MNDRLASYLGTLGRRLDERREAGLGRALETPRGLDFASNDYLGLSRHPALLEGLRDRLESTVPGAPASRLLRGNAPAHVELEARFSRWKDTEASLFFPSGYQANLGLLTAVIGADDRVLSDELNHASLIDGLRLTRARREIVPHLDLDLLEEHLRRDHPGGQTFVVVESLFSMDGDLTPLSEITELCRRHGALLIVDEAHATGVYGDERGSGWVEASGIDPADLLAITSTGGKALGLSGALVSGSRVLMEHLVNHSRPFIYSTAPAPLLAEALLVSLGIVEREPDLRRRLHENIAHLKTALAGKGIELPETSSPIVPVIIGDNHRAVEIAEQLQEEGLDVRALRPPTVPVGTARLRLSIHADHSRDDLDRLAEALGRLCPVDRRSS